MKNFLDIFRALLMLFCFLVFASLVVDLSNAQSAPQQAAAGAMAAALVIVPYVLLRALEGFGSKGGE